MLFRADEVRQQMNRCGRTGEPFLFGVDFEMEGGFFIKNPLTDTRIPFAAGEVTNVLAPAVKESVKNPSLNIIRTDEQGYLSAFETVWTALLHGDTFLLNLTARTPVDVNVTLEQIFAQSWSRYKVLLPDRFVCFSPESFVRIRDGRIYAYPMKGTADASVPGAGQALMDSYKELCEHYTIVDLIRNDLNRVAEHIEVSRFRYMEKVRTLRGDILQTSSEVTGILPADFCSRLGDVVFELLPAGSISGAPKPATVETIRRAEKCKRGYYTGVFGYFDGKNLDSAVMIRFIEKENGCYYFRSGGGITVNSVGQEEYQEVLDKIYLPVRL